MTRFSAHRIVIKELSDQWAENPFASVTEGFVDEEQKIIKNVCVFGKRESLNGYVYEPQAVTTLSRLAQNARFFIDHPAKSDLKERDGVRSVRDWAGMFTNPRQEADKVYADLHVRPVFWDLVKDVATMKPAGIGNSINSVVKVYKDGKGKESILDIERLKSIDLVASAATTQNLFESISDKVSSEREEVEEGLLKEKIAEREKMRKVDNLQWEATDLIREVMKDNTKGITQKKEEVSAIMADLETEIAKILSGKETNEMTPSRNEVPERVASAKEEIKEEEIMDWKILKLEDLRKERPDLIQGLVEEMEAVKKGKEIEQALAELKAKFEALTKEFDELKAAKEALAKENGELKTKVDSFESKEKKIAKEAQIAKLVEAAKLPKEAISEVFMNDLLKKEEKEIQEAINDRLAIWTAKPKPKTVKGAGEEFVEKIESKDEKETLDETKKKEATEKFLKNMGK